jgi:DNA-binding transcriptional LysR family regulator
MDLDLAQVRAFVVTAELSHVGRAAARLFVTQQALSKRIQRLEQALGEELFIRTPRGVELTAAGHRFLPHARQLLATAESAAQAARPNSWLLRLDVWGHVQEPLRTVRRLLADTPELAIELSMRRNLGRALDALLAGEIDACFGRVHDLDRPWPAGLDRRPAVLERCAIAMSTEHPRAGADLLRPADLAGSVLWLPTRGSPPELVAFGQAVAKLFQVDMDLDSQNLGFEQAVVELRTDPRRFMPFGVYWPLPSDAGIRLVPVLPAPCFLWTLVWPSAIRHPLVDVLVDGMTALANTAGLLAFDAEREWMPAADLADLPSPS